MQHALATSKSGRPQSRPAPHPSLPPRQLPLQKPRKQIMAMTSHPPAATNASIDAVIPPGEIVGRRIAAYYATGSRRMLGLRLQADPNGRRTMMDNLSSFGELWAVSGLICPWCVFRRRSAVSPNSGYAYTFLESCLHERPDVDPNLDIGVDDVENAAVSSLTPDEDHPPILGDLVIVKHELLGPHDLPEQAGQADIWHIQANEEALLDRLVRRYALHDYSPGNLFAAHPDVSPFTDDFEFVQLVDSAERRARAAGQPFNRHQFVDAYEHDAALAVARM
uniref:Uncharacterized protein n=1 Tax=Mycena chlorophos TaxID=658473 RepID=A0ABQ0KY60_MYCCL|nr:predicted protein [Mycena chlorophos]